MIPGHNPPLTNSPFGPVWADQNPPQTLPLCTLGHKCPQLINTEMKHLVKSKTSTKLTIKLHVKWHNLSHNFIFIVYKYKNNMFLVSVGLLSINRLDATIVATIVTITWHQLQL